VSSQTANPEKSAKREYKVLVAVDFSPTSAHALRTAASVMGHKPDQIIVLHVIDKDFIKKCINSRIGTEADIKKTLFLQTKKKLSGFIQTEGIDCEPIKMIVCEGIPCLEINKKAVETGADMIIMGNRGNSGDMKTIFFGSTTERVLRFMRCPVLCIPMEEERKE